MDLAAKVPCPALAANGSGVQKVGCPPLAANGPGVQKVVGPCLAAKCTPPSYGAIAA